NFLERGPAPFRLRPKARLARFAREALIPRAHVLADIAAKEVVADRGTQRTRDLAARLDGQVGNALGRIQHMRRGEGMGGTGVETPGARPTAINRERRVRRELQGRQQAADEGE